MRNLGRCLLGILPVALAPPDSTQVQPFRHALSCVRSLLDFTMIAQYRSHTLENISYMEAYETQFNKPKDTLLQFGISKQTQENADELHQELRHQRAQMSQRVPPSQQRRIRDDDREEENSQFMELIPSEYNFNFVKTHLISHFRAMTSTCSAIFPCILLGMDSLDIRSKSRMDGDAQIKSTQHNRN